MPPPPTVLSVTYWNPGGRQSVTTMLLVTLFGPRFWSETVKTTCWPVRRLVGLAVFAIFKSAGSNCTVAVITALAELFAALVSGGVEPVSEALLVNVPALVASAVSARAYPLPTANDGMVQTPLFGLKLVMPGTPALLKLRPGGNTSNTVMLEAELGPRLVMVMVKGTRPPTKTELVPTVLVTCKSTRGCVTVTTTPEELLAGFGSETLAPIIEAVFVNVPPPVAVAKMDRTAELPGYNEPSVQTPVPGL